jgi:hypothetical protein
MEKNNEKVSGGAIDTNQDEANEEDDSRDRSRSHRSFTHFSLEGFRVFSGDFEFLQDYGCKVLESFNSKMNLLFTLKMSKKFISYSFYVLYFLNLCRYTLLLLVYLLIRPNRFDFLEFTGGREVSIEVFYTCFLLFEYRTTLHLNDKLQIFQYTVNIYIVFTVFVLCAVDAITTYYLPMDTLNVIYSAGRTICLFPLFFIIVTLSSEMLDELQNIMSRCCHDPRLSLETYEMVVRKETALTNTSHFVALLPSLHDILEFKVLAAVVFVSWAVMNAVYFETYNHFLLYFFLVTILIASSISQPLYLQRVIRRIEQSNNLSLNFAIEILNIRVSYLWIVLPFLTATAAVVKNLYNIHHCETRN